MAKTQIAGKEIKIDSIRGEQVFEESLDTSKIPFSASEFEASNVKDAIIEAKAEGFSYREITSNKAITIEEDRQMIVKRKIKISGKLIIKGELWIS